MSLLGMRAYAIALRHKILQACERRLGSQRSLADLCGVKLAVVKKRCRRHRPTGAMGPQPPLEPISVNVVLSQ